MRFGLTDVQREERKRLAARKEKIIFAIWPRQVYDGSWRVLEHVKRIKRWDGVYMRYYTFYHPIDQERS